MNEKKVLKKLMGMFNDYKFEKGFIKEDKNCLLSLSFVDGYFYYASKGNDKNLKNNKMAKKSIAIANDYLPKNKHLCLYSDSFTVMELLKIGEEYDITKENNLYAEIIKKGFILNNIIIAEYTNTRIAPLEGYDNRNWTCAERKIIGYLTNNNINCDMIYGTRQPCYYCIPAIKKATYISYDKGNIEFCELNTIINNGKEKKFTLLINKF